jgi:CBS-domain-containing membrane protein
MRAYFVPILAGGTFRDRLLGCLGALVGIGLTSGISAWLVHPHSAFLLIAAPMGAAAVLIFAVPAKVGQSSASRWPGSCHIPNSPPGSPWQVRSSLCR